MIKFMFKTAVASLTLAASVCSASSAAALPTSQQTRLQWASDTNLRPQIYASLQGFAERRRGDYFVPGERIAEQIDQGLSGAPDPEVDLGEGLRFLSAARLHSGRDRAAVVLDSGNQVVYAALLNHACHRVSVAATGAVTPGALADVKTQCDQTAHVTIFAHEKPSRRMQTVFANWARRYDRNAIVELRIFKPSSGR